MKKIIQLLTSFLFIVLNTTFCISFTDSYYTEEKWENFQSKKIPDWKNCESNSLEYTVFRVLRKQHEFECTIQVAEEKYKFHWIKTDFNSYYFISSWDDLRNFGLFPITALALLGIIPNYHERKINIALKVYSPRGLLWEKDYYNYYETWTSLFLIPAMPVQYFLNDENIADRTLLATLEHMVGDLKARELLEK